MILYNCVICILWCLLADREKKTKLIVHNKHLLLLPGNGTAIERGEGDVIDKKKARKEKGARGVSSQAIVVLVVSDHVFMT